MASPPSLLFSLIVAAFLLKPSLLCQAEYHKERKKFSQSLLSAKADLPSLPNHHSVFNSPILLIVPILECSKCQCNATVTVLIIINGRFEGIGIREQQFISNTWLFPAGKQGLPLWSPCKDAPLTLKMSKYGMKTPCLPWASQRLSLWVVASDWFTRIPQN